MKPTYVLNNQITSSLVDNGNKMRFDTLLSTFQDLAVFHSIELGVGFYDLLKKSNALWVLTKVKLYADKMPLLSENVEFTTYPTDISLVRFIREFTASGDMGAKVIGHSEWCLLDATNFSVRRSNSIDYPFDLERRTDNVGLEFTNTKCEILDEDYSYTYSVCLTDIDCNNHVNNVAYARMALNTFTPNGFNKFDFKSFEIKFINQAFYGCKIKVFKKQINENTVYILGKTDEKQIFSVILSK